jgi:hypothetical protein
MDKSAPRGKIKQIARETALVFDSRDLVQLSSMFILAREVRQTLWGLLMRLMVCVNEPLQQGDPAATVPGTDPYTGETGVGNTLQERM